MTKKHMDDRLRVFSCDTQKQQKLHLLLLAPFSLTKHLFVKIISITYFVMKKKYHVVSLTLCYPLQQN